ncbi:hypothetical protein GRJ2_001886300 [Grus japonensis]|uniref:Uncharacterized protein n=1 Tax=Grus japonensis TaxID=30415 RepID=A0ABC9X9A5_GRUJA
MQGPEEPEQWAGKDTGTLMSGDVGIGSPSTVQPGIPLPTRIHSTTLQTVKSCGIVKANGEMTPWHDAASCISLSGRSSRPPGASRP